MKRGSSQYLHTMQEVKASGVLFSCTSGENQEHSGVGVGGRSSKKVLNIHMY